MQRCKPFPLVTLRPLLLTFRFLSSPQEMFDALLLLLELADPFPKLLGRRRRRRGEQITLVSLLELLELELAAVGSIFGELLQTGIYVVVRC